jgi:hypothetical protein
MDKVKVLFLAVNPQGTQPLNLSEEFLQIFERAQKSKFRHSLEIIPRRDVRPEDVAQVLMSERPHIFHFCGHANLVLQTGSRSDSVRDFVSKPTPAACELILQNAQGNRVPVNQGALVHLFKTIPDNLRVVVLNACHTRPLAEAIAETIDCTIGMNRPIGDEAAIAFAGSFYEAIGFGRSVKEAFELGRNMMMRQGIPEHETPELLTRPGIDAAGLVLIPSIDKPTPVVSPEIVLPDLPPRARYLPRQDEVDACRELLFSDDQGAVAITAPSPIALRGMGGVGKSVLANAVARDAKTQERFCDGIFWVSVGQEGAGQEAKAMALQAELCTQLGEPPQSRPVQQGKEHLRKLLAERACLIVLDDVWDIRDAQRMDVAGPRSRILITTRDGSLVNDLDAKEYPLGLLALDQATTLLEKWSVKPVRGDVAALNVVRECGRLPLALAICGAMARDGMTWDDIVVELRTAEVISRERPGIDPQYETILKSIQASVSSLAKTDAKAVECYRYLAVFSPDRPVPEAVVTMLWQKIAQCTEAKARLWLSMLERKSLLNLEGEALHPRVSLHDLHHDYVRQSHPDVSRLHQNLIDAYRSKCPGGWSSGPDDGYFFLHLAYHLNQAGLGDELHRLLLNFDWLEAKLRATDVVQLLADFDLASADGAITLVRDALRLSAQYLARDATLLRSQLRGRLLGVESAEIQSLLRDTGGRDPWLRCLTPSLTAPGGELISTLEGHSGLVTAVAMSGDGRRAVSGSRDKTLKVWDLATGQVLRTLEGHAADVTAVAMSGDGTRAVSASYDKTLRVWDLTTGELLRTLEGHAGWVTAVAMSGDGTRAVSGSEDTTLKVWDLTSGEVIATFAADYDIRCCACSTRATTLVAGDSSERVHLLRLEGTGLGR